MPLNVTLRTKLFPFTAKKLQGKRFLLTNVYNRQRGQLMAQTAAINVPAALGFFNTPLDRHPQACTCQR
jgi:hypothetical protein